MRFLKRYNIMTAGRALLVLEVCHQVAYEWHLDTTLKTFLHDFKGFAKDEEVVEVNKAMSEKVNNFNQSMVHNWNLSVDKDDIEELLDVVPVEWTNELLKQKCIDEEETKKKRKKKRKRTQQRKKKKNLQENLY